MMGPDRWRRRTAAAIALLVAGCTTTADPHRGGFFSGVKNLSDGTYRDRQRQQEAELAMMKQQQQAAEARAAEARAAVAERQARVAALRQEIAALDARIARQQAVIERRRAGQPPAEAGRRRAADLAALRGRLTALQRQSGQGVEPADYDRIRQEYVSVQRALAAMGGAGAPGGPQ